MQASGSPDAENENKEHGVVFSPAPDWYRDVVYLEEGERGFDDTEDLFMPGLLEISLPPLPEGGCVYVTAGTEPCLEDLGEVWKAERRARLRAHKSGRGLAGHLAQAGEQFCIETPSGRPTIIAGYHWFDDWGRDTFISLPGLTFHAGRADFGLRVMADKICAVLRYPCLAAELVKNCREEMKSIRWENTADQLLVVYRNLLGGR